MAEYVPVEPRFAYVVEVNAVFPSSFVYKCWNRKNKINYRSLKSRIFILMCGALPPTLTGNLDITVSWHQLGCLAAGLAALQIICFRDILTCCYSGTKMVDFMGSGQGWDSEASRADGLAREGLLISWHQLG